MPIEFACENCARILRVPDGSSGKKSQCPACGRAQEIPYVINAGAERPANSRVHDRAQGVAAENDAGNVAGNADDKLSIPCPKCKHHLVCSPELVGTRGQCRKCQHIFTITTEPEKQRREEMTALVFSCPKCHQLFEGKPEMQGRSGRCHVCQAVFPIELRPAESAPAAETEIVKDSSAASPHVAASLSAPRATKPATAVRGSSAAQPGVTKPARQALAPKKRTAPPAAPKKPIQFMCVHCQGLMEVPGSSAGLDTACPYCQTVQKIPAASAPAAAPIAVSAPAAAGGASYNSSLPADALFGAQGAFDAVGSQHDPLATANPYAIAPQSQWQSPTRRRSRRGLTFGNVFVTAFEGLFPTCLVTVLHTIVAIGCGIMLSVFMFAMMLMVAALKLGQQGTFTAAIALYIMMAPLWLAIGAWYSTSIRHMALRAVRKREFDFNKAFSPGGGYGAGLLMALLATLVQLFPRAPQLVNLYSPGAMDSVIVPWIIVTIVLAVFFFLSTSLVWFAAIDGDATGDAFGTSFRLVFSNLPIMVAVKVLVWIATIVLFVPTLGLSLTLPAYFNATLYHLARDAE